MIRKEKMNNQELERKISKIIADIGENRLYVRPENEWLQDKYNRYRQ